ncbi:hypothetical protein CAL26_21005 [Bordetella genomosp. 9]|uniref:Uncharacterized protein n=2 Tax=Bordetella TaxID=517 RepID=A0A261R4T0_9BORD|nr:MULTISPECIES: hypothetical protein [Bordetella]ARP83254.1 hypothetical protein CAL12_22150 [Bordetella genomosp. 8]OZI20035.1 hypothetical protein CAL26_21005 [Bordetella genomosp. 9]
MNVNENLRTSTSAIDQETANVDASFRENMNAPALDIASAQRFALMSGNLSFKSTCAAGMIKLVVSSCKDIVRVVGT